MFIQQEISIAIPSEMMDELQSPIDNMMPRMIITDAMLSGMVVKALVAQLADNSATLEKTYGEHKHFDTATALDSVSDMKRVVRETMFTASALYLALTNAAVIIEHKG